MRFSVASGNPEKGQVVWTLENTLILLHASEGRQTINKIKLFFFYMVITALERKMQAKGEWMEVEF